MTQHCITCWIKFLNTKGIDHNLMNLCPTCKKASPEPKFTRSEAINDLKNNLQAVTCTLKLKFHDVPQSDIIAFWRKMVTVALRDRNSPNYFEGYFEYHESGVIHLHAFCAGRKNVMSPLYNSMRRLGHVLVKPIFDQQEWLNYITSAQTEDSPKPIIITT